MNLEPYEKELEKLNACIWDYAELKFQEVRSAGAMEDLLEQHGLCGGIRQRETGDRHPGRI